jgi:hypothetical protein
MDLKEDEIVGEINVGEKSVITKMVFVEEGAKRFDDVKRDFKYAYSQNKTKDNETVKKKESEDVDEIFEESELENWRVSNCSYNIKEGNEDDKSIKEGDKPPSFQSPHSSVDESFNPFLSFPPVKSYPSLLICGTVVGSVHIFSFSYKSYKSSKNLISSKNQIKTATSNLWKPLTSPFEPQNNTLTSSSKQPPFSPFSPQNHPVPPNSLFSSSAFSSEEKMQSSPVHPPKSFPIPPRSIPSLQPVLPNPPSASPSPVHFSSSPPHPSSILQSSVPVPPNPSFIPNDGAMMPKTPLPPPSPVRSGPSCTSQDVVAGNFKVYIKDIPKPRASSPPPSFSSYTNPSSLKISFVKVKTLQPFLYTKILSSAGLESSSSVSSASSYSSSASSVTALTYIDELGTLAIGGEKGEFVLWKLATGDLLNLNDCSFLEGNRLGVFYV